MRTAYEDCVAYFRRMVEVVRETDRGLGPWVLVSSVVHSLVCEAGMEITLSQFNKSNNMLLIADARGAIRSYGKTVLGNLPGGRRPREPGRRTAPADVWLSLYLAFVAGASQVNDEENLYHTWHQRFYGPSDKVPTLRRHIMRSSTATPRLTRAKASSR